MTTIEPSRKAFAPSIVRRARPPAVTIAAIVAIVAMAIAALGDIVRHPDAALVRSDFSAFYCGAVVASKFGDPYALAPLRACEAANVDVPGGIAPSVIGVDPDPLPGYNMAFFMPFTLLPFREAALLWDLLLIAAIAGTAAILTRLTGLRFIVVAAILASVDGLACIPFGQTAPLVTFGLALAGYGFVRERLGWIVGGAALSMLVPQIGLPTCIAIFVWRPAIRPAIIALGAVLLGVTLLVLGVPLNLEYLRAELPTHAIAEGTTSTQYSLAWLLHYFGVPDRLAIRTATIQYGIFMLAGVLFAGRVARKLDTPAAIVLFPPAVALIGGSFIHLQQMAAALPFALMLASRTRYRVAWLAVLLLVVPWPAQTGLVTLGATAVVALITLIAFPRASLRVPIGVACSAALAYALIAGPVMERIVPALPARVLVAEPVMPRALDGDRLASDEDGREVRRDPAFAVATPRTLVSRLPIWLALGAIVALGLTTKPSRRRPELAPA